MYQDQSKELKEIYMGAMHNMMGFDDGLVRMWMVMRIERWL